MAQNDGGRECTCKHQDLFVNKPVSTEDLLLCAECGWNKLHYALDNNAVDTIEALCATNAAEHVVVAPAQEHSLCDFISKLDLREDTVLAMDKLLESSCKTFPIEKWLGTTLGFQKTLCDAAYDAIDNHRVQSLDVLIRIARYYSRHFADYQFFEVSSPFKSDSLSSLLARAARKGCRATVQLLLDDPFHCKTIRVRNGDNNTALHAAVLNHGDDGMAILNMLLNHLDHSCMELAFESANVLNGNDLTPLQLALMLAEHKINPITGKDSFVYPTHIVERLRAKILLLLPRTYVDIGIGREPVRGGYYDITSIARNVVITNDVEICKAYLRRINADGVTCPRIPTYMCEAIESAMYNERYDLVRLFFENESFRNSERVDTDTRFTTAVRYVRYDVRGIEGLADIYTLLHLLIFLYNCPRKASVRYHEDVKAMFEMYLENENWTMNARSRFEHNTPLHFAARIYRGEREPLASLWNHPRVDRWARNRAGDRAHEMFRDENKRGLGWREVVLALNKRAGLSASGSLTAMAFNNISQRYGLEHTLKRRWPVLHRRTKEAYEKAMRDVDETKYRLVMQSRR